MKSLIDAMLEKEVIECSQSPWSLPIVLVKKKDDSTHFCVVCGMSLQLPERMHNHYHRLITPLDVLGSAQLFSTLDQASGYWQVKVNPEDREKAVFMTPYGLLQLHVMPFGLTNAPTKFQRLMEQILYEILIFITTVEEHLERLCDVLDRLKNAETK